MYMHALSSTSKVTLGDQVRSMGMPMMNIGVVHVSVLDRIVCVGVGMRLLAIPVRVMLMLVMCVVDMRVFVRKGRMTMPMCMNLGEMQPHPCPHEESRDQ